MKERTTCRVCGYAPLAPILSLGDLYVSDFVEDAASGGKAPLELVLCNEEQGGCGLLQLKHTVSHESLYRNYWYRSGMNKTMTLELEGIAKAVQAITGLKSGDYVIDIGANDGTLLRGYTAQGISRVGFEPAKNLGKYNAEGTTKIIPDFFSFEGWRKEFGDQRAKAVTAIAMFYDLEDPNAFVGDVTRCLDPEGAFIIQMSYLPLMLSQNAFDNICHEHLEYYSLLSLENLLKRHGLEVFDVELNDVNGGSFRIYMRHANKGKNLVIPPGAEERISKLRASERALGLNASGVYEAFGKRIEAMRGELMDFVRREAAQGKTVHVYGASTKGNTLLQYYGLDASLIKTAAERNPDKWGKKTVGTLIPIVSEEEARKANPDYFLVLPWHFIEEFKHRESEFLKRGGKFIVPLPEVKIFGSDAV